MKKLKKIIRKYLPESITNYLIKSIIKYRRLKDMPMIKKQPKLHETALSIVKTKAKNGEKIKVVFFAIHSSVWKYEGVYKLFEKDDRFEPLVVVCPVVNYGRENMLYEMDKAYTFFKENGYRVVRTYDEVDDKYLDVKKEIDPDIVFYTNPYKGLIDDRYFITEFRDRLTCYVNYGISITSSSEITYDAIFSHLLWKFFHETKLHYEIALSFNKSSKFNGFLSGYPGVDRLLYGKRTNGNCWKKTDEDKKRVIWAPHHTIEKNGWIELSNFLDYSEKMLKLSIKFKDSVQFVFKPHPLLKIKLYNHNEWGKKRTDEYYQKWIDGENTNLITNQYIELFNSSDALIHDCGSFIAEYLYCGKPAMYINANKTIEQYNDFARMALKQHYNANSIKDIEQFIDKVVIDGFDPMKNQREQFYNNILMEDLKESGSLNIYKMICATLIGQEI